MCFDKVLSVVQGVTVFAHECGTGARTFLTFLYTAAIAYHQNHKALTDYLPICNTTHIYKRQKIMPIRHYRVP